MASLQDISAGNWNIDPTHSEIGFTVRHLMISKVRGKFTDFSATATSAQPVENSVIEFTIQTASVDTGNTDRDTHLKSADFFDVEQYPTMTFKATSINERQITGDFTLRGVTKPVTLDYTFNGTTTDPWGATRAGFEASGEINRTDFGMTFNAPLETGGVMLAENIKIALDLEFVQA